MKDARVGRLATRDEVAEYLGVPPATLRQWAYRDKGPRYVRVGRHVRHDWGDVERWLAEQETGGGGCAA